MILLLLHMLLLLMLLQNLHRSAQLLQPRRVVHGYGAGAQQCLHQGKERLRLHWLRRLHRLQRLHWLRTLLQRLLRMLSAVAFCLRPRPLSSGGGLRRWGCRGILRLLLLFPHALLTVAACR